jgi:ABC-type transport system involved in multi-copper enzyme maturation permease subunit
VRINDYVQSTLDVRANETAERQAHRDSHFWRFQWNGMNLERPVLPLSILVTGTERNPDPRFRVFQKSKPIIRASGSIDRNPLITLSSPLDIMFITGIVMSLLVLVLSFDAVAGERQDGTLKLLLSFPVPRSSFIFAKWVGGLLTLSLPFVIGYLCMAIWIVLSGKVIFTSAEWIAFVMIGVASLLYIAWMFSAALLVSCWCRHAATAMCMLLLVWVVLVLIIPNISPYFAALFKQTDSIQSVQFKSMKTVKDIQKEERKQFDELCEKYNTRRWWRHDRGWPEGVKIASDGHDRLRQATRTIVDGRDTQLIEQTDLARAISRISPFAAYADIVTHLAWTGPNYERHLRRHLREYEDQLRRITTDSLIDGTPFTPEHLPHFRYRPPSMSHRFMASLMDWIILLSGTVIFFLAAYVSFVTREII